MANVKFEKWISDNGLNIIKCLAREGMTESEIGARIGVSGDTLRKWRRKFPELDDAMWESELLAYAMVKNSLYESALKGSVTAQLAWLKNHYPESWGGEKGGSGKAKDIVIEDLTAIEEILGDE